MDHSVTKVTNRAVEWRFASRINSFKMSSGSGSTEAAMRLAATVPGLTALEINYPQHFVDGEPESTFAVAEELQLPVTALNLRFDPPTFSLGSFAHPDPLTRAAAIQIAFDAMHLAAIHGVGHVILWLGPDGFDYPFQVKYADLWARVVDGVAAVASSHPDVRLSIEYKPSEPRSFALVRGMSDALLLARDAAEPNVGVTLDVCHALMCGESPAMSADMALREGRLYGVHLNDGYGLADDGAMVGSIHLAQTLELLWILREGSWNGTIYFDTFPNRIDPVDECRTNIATVQKLLGVLDRMDVEQLRSIQAGQLGGEAANLVQQLLTQ